MESKKNGAVSQENGLPSQKKGLVLRKTGLRVLNELETAQVGSGLVATDADPDSSAGGSSIRLPPQKITWAKCPGAYSGGCAPA